jgi:hypothetical protein
MIHRLGVHDPALPQLRLALEAESMRAEFARRIKHSSYRVVNCAVEHVRYQPGKHALICYRLTLRDARSSTECQQVLTARLYPPGESCARFEEANAQRLLPPAFGLPLAHIESLAMVVWAFPNEQQLKGIAALDNARALRETILAPVVRAHWGVATNIVGLANEIVGYLPEHYLTIRVELKLEKASGETLPWRLVGKHYPDDRGRETHSVMQQLWASAARMRGELGIARPIAYQPRLRILWQEAPSAFARNFGAGDSMAQAGAAAAEPHALGRRPETTALGGSAQSAGRA